MKKTKHKLSDDCKKIIISFAAREALIMLMVGQKFGIRRKPLTRMQRLKIWIVRKVWNPLIYILGLN